MAVFHKDECSEAGSTEWLVVYRPRWRAARRAWHSVHAFCTGILYMCARSRRPYRAEQRTRSILYGNNVAAVISQNLCTHTTSRCDVAFHLSRQSCSVARVDRDRCALTLPALSECMQ